jgi:hypothetical protein
MTPDEIKAEIAEARRIVREDQHILAIRGVREKLDKHFPDEPEAPAVPEGTPPAPEPVDPPADPPKPKSKWWGDAID